MNILKLILTCALIFEQVFFPVSGLFAQNNTPAQDMQAPAGEEGGPMLEEQAGPALDAPPPSVMPRGQTPGSPIDSLTLAGETPRETPMYEESESISPLDRKIGPIRLKGAPLSTFLDVVSAQSKVNFIITEGLEAKTITVFLRKTTVREALELLLRVKGLTYQRIGKSNTYVVQKRSVETPNLITKIYTLNFIPLIPITSTKEEMSAITAPDVSAGGSSSGGGGEASQGAEDEAGGKSKDEDGGVAIIKIVRSVLSKKYGKIATDPRTNTLIITDMPEVFPQVEQIIAELDKKAPQILIEAQIVEIGTDRINELGIEWGQQRGDMAKFTGPSRPTDFGLRSGFYNGNNQFFEGSVKSTTWDKTDPKVGLVPGVLSLAELQAVFRALISRGEARYLGKPKIVAMNNKTALIQSSRDAAVGMQQSSQGNGSASTQTVERRRLGLAFKVTPQVNKEGYVTLIVQPSYSDAVDSPLSQPNAIVRDPISRGASTMVRVKNGQTVVIGGMLSSTETKTVRKVPLLGYIPIVGWLFTSVSSQRRNTDLVIFVTPTILVD